MSTFTQGIELEKQGKYEEALPFFQQAIEEHPESYIGWTHLSYDLCETEEYEGALKAAERALAINLQYAPAWITKARALNELDPPRPEEGIAACKRAISYDPNNAMAYLTFGKILGSQQLENEALAEFDRALAIDSNLWEALRCKAMALLILNRCNELQLVAERLIRLAPNDERGWCFSAFALYIMKEHGEALQAINRALAINPNSSMALTYKSSIVYEMGDKSEARVLARRAAELDPQNELAQMSKTELNKERNEKIMRVSGAIGSGIFGGISEMIKAVFRP